MVQSTLLVEHGNSDYMHTIPSRCTIWRSSPNTQYLLHQQTECESLGQVFERIRGKEGSTFAGPFQLGSLDHHARVVIVAGGLLSVCHVVYKVSWCNGDTLFGRMHSATFSELMLFCTTGSVNATSPIIHSG